MSEKTLDLIDTLYTTSPTSVPTCNDPSTIKNFEDKVDSFELQNFDIHFIKVIKDKVLKYIIEANTNQAFSINLVLDPKSSWKNAVIVEWDGKEHKILVGDSIKSLYNKVLSLTEDQTKLSINEFTYGNFKYME